MVTARPVEHDVRSGILAEATRLFADQGLGGTSLQDIADAVGLTKAGVLHHFPSKEHVWRAVLDAIVAHWKDVLPRLLLAATASEDRFNAVFGELFRFFAADPNRARVVIRETLDRPADVKRLLTGPIRPWIGAVAEYIRAGQETGRHYSDVDAEAYVLHVLQLVLTAAASSQVTSLMLEPPARERYDRELARIARASLFPSAHGRAPSPATPISSAPPPPEASQTSPAHPFPPAPGLRPKQAVSEVSKAKNPLTAPRARKRKTSR